MGNSEEGVLVPGLRIGQRQGFGGPCSLSIKTNKNKVILLHRLCLSPHQRYFILSLCWKVENAFLRDGDALPNEWQKVWLTRCIDSNPLTLYEAMSRTYPVVRFFLVKRIPCPYGPFKKYVQILLCMSTSTSKGGSQSQRRFNKIKSLGFYSDRIEYSKKRYIPLQMPIHPDFFFLFRLLDGMRSYCLAVILEFNILVRAKTNVRIIA